KHGFRRPSGKFPAGGFVSFSPAQCPEIDSLSPSAMNFARNLGDLIQELSRRSGVSVTRRSIQRWRRDPRYKAFCPQPCANGSHKVSEYLVFMRRFGLKRADEVLTAEETSPDRKTIRDWKEHREK